MTEEDFERRDAEREQRWMGMDQNRAERDRQSHRELYVGLVMSIFGVLGANLIGGGWPPWCRLAGAILVALTMLTMLALILLSNLRYRRVMKRLDRRHDELAAQIREDFGIELPPPPWRKRRSR